MSTRATKAATVPRTKYRRQPSSGVVGPRGGGPTQSWGPQGPRGAGPSGTGSSSASSSCQIREAYGVRKRPSAPRAGVSGEGDPVSLRPLATTVPPKITGANPLHPRSGGTEGRQEPRAPPGSPGSRTPGSGVPRSRTPGSRVPWEQVRGTDCAGGPVVLGQGSLTSFTLLPGLQTLSSHVPTVPKLGRV